jgi:hypothetical protein
MPAGRFLPWSIPPARAETAMPDRVGGFIFT